MDQWLDEEVQTEIDIAKLQGLQATRKAINTWNHNKQFKWELLPISNETANKLIQGKFKTFEEFRKNADQDAIRFNNLEVLIKEIYSSNIEDYIYVIETIFIDE